MGRTVLATIGSLGDLHPFIAIGRALLACGEHVTLAVPEDGLTKVRAAGLEAVSIFPSYATICAHLGMTEQEVATRVIADTDFVVDQVLMPSLSMSVSALDEAAKEADVLAGSIFAFAAEIVAEKRKLPLASVVLQPMTLFSSYAPPTAPRFEIMRHQPRTSIGRTWNRAVYSLARIKLRGRYAARIDAVRQEHGLAPSIGMPLLDYSRTAAATLCCWSDELGALPPDAPGGSVLVGFPFFDSDTGRDEPLAAELEAFLTDGEAPLVFTLGSVAVIAAGQFYDEARAISRALGRRAVMLTGEAGPSRIEDDCLVMGYAPHSHLFPRAAAVVHHGGIGTTGQALRAGRPQVVVPHFGDQFDNAARLTRLGLAATIKREAFNRRVGVDVIGTCVTDAAMAEKGRRAAETIKGEDGAAAAASCITAIRQEIAN